jgi:S-adenosylmethionine synthetase
LSPENFVIECRIGETSTDLEENYEETLSNDTSYGVGHAHFSQLERSIKNVTESVRRLEEVGEDVKVMGLRREKEAKITVAAAVISSRVQDLAEYREVIGKIKEEAKDKSEADAKIRLNTADDIERGIVYITETGTSAEMGDDGSVGRGNRVNGLITPNRSMSMEAASGKNPVTHVGKIYNLKADQISRKIHEETGGFAQVKILLSIGSPVRASVSARRDNFRG